MHTDILHPENLKFQSMKENAEITILPYCWLTVCRTFFNRYPNPYSLHVLSEDTVHREIKDGKFLSTRIFCKTASLPNLFKKFVKKPQVTTTTTTTNTNTITTLFRFLSFLVFENVTNHSIVG